MGLGRGAGGDEVVTDEPNQDLDRIVERVQKILALGRRGGTEAEAAAAVAAAVAASLDAEAAQREVLIEVAEQFGESEEGDES